MNKIIFYPLLLVFSILLLSCSKDGDVMTSEGILTWTGAYSVDGCGFFIEIEGVEYKPKNEPLIENKFKTLEQIPVIVEYIPMNRQVETWCGDMSSPMLNEGIELKSIRKK